MYHLLHVVAYLLVAVSMSFAQAPELEALKAPSCIRVISSTATEATIQFEPHGGESFEAERYYGGRWLSFKSNVRTSGTKNSVTVPLSKNLYNMVRICAESGTNRVCSSEGVYAKR